MKSIENCSASISIFLASDFFILCLGREKIKINHDKSFLLKRPSIDLNSTNIMDVKNQISNCFFRKIRRRKK